MKHFEQTDEITYGIIGLGRFGFALAVELGAMGNEILVMDQDEEKVRMLREYTEHAFVVSRLDRNTLLETGVQDCDVAVVGIGDQVDVSILTTLQLVNLGVETVIAKATSEEHGQVLKKLGAEVVYPEHDTAVWLAQRLRNSRMLDFIQFSEKLNISKLAIPEKMINKTVRELEFRGKYGLNIIAIENRDALIENIQPEYVFRKGDILYASGSKESLAGFAQWPELR